MKLVLSCEHGGNEIPNTFAALFKGHDSLLNSHRGYDPGTLDLFNFLKPGADFALSNTVSRLLIEYNRSLHHAKLFSEISCGLSPAKKRTLVDRYYLPYRSEIENTIGRFIRDGHMVLHLSLHSFAPLLDGNQRTNDIGLLYDPKRPLEKDFSRRFKRRLLEQDSSLNIRANYPYLGKADGFTTHLRKCFQQQYLGIELELNQGLVTDNAFPANLKQQIKTVLTTV